MSDEDDARLGQRTLIVGAMALALIGITVHGSMPLNAISFGVDRDLQTTAWAPQSWKFFTRDPQEEQIVLFAPRNGTWERFGVPGGSPRYAFGIDRAGRAEGMELALLIAGVPPSSFHACGEDVEPADCLAKTTKTLHLKNELPRPMLCGPLAVVGQKPVPWVWARSGRKTIMPARVLRIDVECS